MFYVNLLHVYITHLNNFLNIHSKQNQSTARTGGYPINMVHNHRDPQNFYGLLFLEETSSFKKKDEERRLAFVLKDFLLCLISYIDVSCLTNGKYPW